MATVDVSECSVCNSSDADAGSCVNSVGYDDGVGCGECSVGVVYASYVCGSVAGGYAVSGS